MDEWAKVKADREFFSVPEQGGACRRWALRAPAGLTFHRVWF
jgi:hypothetical protein